MSTVDIGILDPDGINLNPLNNKPYSEQYKILAKKWSNFPAYQDAKNIIEIIKSNQVILVISSTGSGKTVLFPKFMLHVLNYSGKIAITLPKQIIAKSAADFAAKTLDVELGKDVGYKYKGSEKSGVSNNTKLLYATDGTIVARLLNDPELKDFDAVIIDEAHERKVQIDFLLYLLKQTLMRRPEFKLIIMSATIDESLFSSYFSKFKYANISVEGKSHYPIKSIFLDEPLQGTMYLEKGLDIINKIVNSKTDDNSTEKNSKDILFFVTSINETFDMCEKMKEIAKDGYCIEVFAGMNASKQELAQEKNVSTNRKIVVATNVAESSLTIDGIKYVIDSGYELSGHYDANKKAKVLERKLITQAQAKQRMGRSGRTEPGVCYHLYTKNDFDNIMEKFPQPTIRVSNIYGEFMRLLNIPTINTVENLLDVLTQFIEPPREAYIKSGLMQLTQLGIIENNKITELGKIISDTQMDPMQGLTLYGAYQLMCAKEVAGILSMLEAMKGNMSELFILPLDLIEDDDKGRLKQMTNKFNNARKDVTSKYGDHLSLYKILSKYQKLKDSKDVDDWIYKHFLKRTTLEKATKAFKKMRGIIGKFGNVAKINIDRDILNDKIEYRIMAAFGYGFRLNVAFYNNNRYETNHANNIGIKRDSFILTADTMHKQVLYNELVCINNKCDINIVSVLPKKSATIINALLS